MQPEEASLQLETEAAPVTPGSAWAERLLSPSEREVLRACYPARRGPDLGYLSRLAGFVVAFTAIGNFVLARALGLPHRPLTAAGFAVVGLAIAAFYNPKRLRRALRSRRAHVPRRVWVWPVTVSPWRGKNRDGDNVYEVRCSLDGQTKAVEVSPEQWEWFDAGPALVEILPGGRRRVYRFRYGAEAIQVYPNVCRLRDGETGVSAIASVSAESGRERNRAAPSSAPRRKRHRADGRHRKLRVRRQDLIWLGVVLIVGTSLTLIALQSENRPFTPPRPAGNAQPGQ